jgi:fumarate reductase flavoprotein subunit
MAGLVAAARARELGADVVVFEKGTQPGGSMYLSSCVIWRYGNFERFRAECPGGDPELQRVVWEGLDDALGWLESLGAPVVERDTGNPLTTGTRFDPGGLTESLARRAVDLRLGAPLTELPEGLPVVLATGGFQGNADLVRGHITPEAANLVLRANPWSTGDGLRLALAAGAAESAGLDEFYGRNLAAVPQIAPEDFVPLSQVYARHARVENLRGEVYEARTWSEIDVVQWLARRPGARGWLVVAPDKLGEPTPYGSVAEQIARAEAAGAEVRRAGTGTVSVHVAASVTTTLGGLAADARCRVADGVWAAGADAGGIAAGGYASGLAGALVTGRIAAEGALAA